MITIHVGAWCFSYPARLRPLIGRCISIKVCPLICSISSLQSLQSHRIYLYHLCKLGPERTFEHTYIMAPIPSLRTYTLKSAQSAIQFSTHWKSIAAALEQNHNVLTTGVYLSRSNPTQVRALVHYPSGSEPEKVMADFAKSDAFKKALNGFDMSEFQARPHEEILDPIDV